MRFAAVDSCMPERRFRPHRLVSAPRGVCRIACLLLLMLIACVPPVSAQDEARTPSAPEVMEAPDYREEVVALVERAAAYIKENGKEKALAAFNDPEGPFVKNGLYVFAYDFFGVNKALATNPALVGRNLIDMRDADGKDMIRDLIKVAQGGGGWYEYKWEGHDKLSYVVKVDDTLWIGSGDYKSEVVSLVEKALAYIKRHGKEMAIAEFNNPRGQFVDRSLYIFAYDFNGVNKALTTHPSLVGKNLLDMKDADGKEFIKDMIAVVKKGGGWYDYEWQGREKTSYVVKVDDTLWIGCGEYNESASRTYYLFAMALIPIAWLMVSLGVLKMPAQKATAIGLAATALLAFFVFKMPLLLVSSAALEGVALGLWPIMIVIVAAIFTYNMALHTRSMDTIKTMLADITTDRRIQVLILAWGFGGFLEAVAGYGTAVAIPASILAALGCPPLFAALICLTANTVPTAFGAIGIPVLTLAQIANLDVNVLSYQIALQLTLFIVVIPSLLVVLTTRSFKGLKGVMGISLASGAAFAVPELLCAKYLGAELPALAGSICSMAVTILIAKLFYKEQRAESDDRARIGLKQGILAWLPYILVLVFIVGTSPVVAPVHAALSTIKTSVFIYQGKDAAPFVFKWIATPGTLIVLATLVGGLIQGARPGEIARVFGYTVKKLSLSAATVLCIVSMSKVMAYSGMISAIAVVLVKTTGQYFSLISPLIGALGTFVTGSDTSANVLFGKLQVEVASKTGIDPYWLAAANTAGATGGKMISPQSIAVATAATGLVGSEGRLLNQTLTYCFFYVAFLGVFVYLGSLY
ncbi:lactate permease LctP family transporter, partial [Fundidesulfovibrio magnetotacticus]|uniref:lactate permease LctP family transporter n=1 Tax=Fundidesulfovibrio magnetotacticus TaxID=2730080 RepID=UPI0015670AC7